jgi:hypothetical protein
VVKQGTRETKASEHPLGLVDEDGSVVHEWEFMCECGHEDCHESVFLTVADFVTLRDAGAAVVAEGHHLSPVVHARRVRNATQALRAQAEHQVKRAKKNLGLT